MPVIIQICISNWFKMEGKMLFKKKNGVVDNEPIPYDIPATYGAEYDEYDYLYTKMPNDTSKWERYYEKCQSCGTYHWFNKVDTHYFYTMDGYDSISYTECWCCNVKSKVYGIKSKMKKQIKQRKEHREFINLLRKNGVPVTKEVKESTRKIFQSGG